jgi:hypothetical protein
MSTTNTITATDTTTTTTTRIASIVIIENYKNFDKRANKNNKRSK